MYKKLILTVCISTLLLIGAINLFGLKGSGNIISEERPLGSFHSVLLNCLAKVTIVQGNTNTAKIKADDNVMAALKTEEKRGTLEISFSKIITESRVDIELTMQDISKLEIIGSGIITVNDPLPSGNIELRITGSGSINIEVESKFVFSKIFGPGIINIKGNTEALELELSGTGVVNSFDLKSKNTKITINGEGECKVSVSDDLNIKVGGFGGKGKIDYKGKPKLTVDIFGSALINSD